MARHRARKKRLRWLVTAALAAVAVAIAATAAALLREPEPPPRAAPAEPADPVDVDICTTLRVVTATSFEPVLSELAPMLSQGGDCVRLDIEVADGQAAEARVAETAADVWIPDDAAWAGVVRTAELDPEAAGAGTVVATSPIYMVTDQTTAARLNQAGGGWLDLAGLLTADTGTRLAVRDPAGSGDGLIGVGAVGEAVWLDAGMDASAEALMTAFPSTLTVTEHALPARQGDVGLVAEYALSTLLAGGGESATTIRSATVLAGSDYSAVLKYTWLPTVTGTGDVKSIAALDRLLQLLTGDDSAAALAEAGLRGADGQPFDQAGDPFPAVDAPAFDVLGAHQVDHVFATWYPGERTSDVLVVIDVSGSMAAPAPGSDTPLIDLVREGVIGLAELLPDDSELSLWQFGAQLDPPRDYVELLPRAQLDAGHRGALRDSANEMVTTETGTGLYDTTLAAYLNARESYRQGIASHVLVFTDGRNEDRPDSISIEQLAADLVEATDPARPVQLTVITFGDDTDAELLESALDETGTYIAHITSAEEVHAVFIHQAAGGRH
jgi:hypothetical protein